MSEQPGHVCCAAFVLQDSPSNSSWLGSLFIAGGGRWCDAMAWDRDGRSVSRPPLTEPGVTPFRSGLRQRAVAWPPARPFPVSGFWLPTRARKIHKREAAAAHGKGRRA